MLHGSRYLDKDFEAAEKLLGLIKRAPTALVIGYFEQQFINQKVKVALTVIISGETV